MMKKNISLRIPDETMRIIDTIAKKGNINKSQVIEVLADMSVGNFTYEDIMKHVGIMDFVDYRAGRTYSKNKD